MLAIIIFLCGLLGFWVDIYSFFAVILFTVYYYAAKKIEWEYSLTLIGFALAGLNIILYTIFIIIKDL